MSRIKEFKSNTTAMEWITEFLNSEKTLYLFAGIIGIISFIVGLLFFMFSDHKSFALTMIGIGILEMALLLPVVLNFQEKINSKIEIYQSNVHEYVENETVTTKKALKSFFWLKMIYAFSIVVLVLIMSFLKPGSALTGIFTALILHLAFAITIDNFGEKYTRTYLDALQQAKAGNESGV